MVCLAKMVFAIELPSHANNRYEIKQLRKSITRLAIENFLALFLTIFLDDFLYPNL